MDYYAFFRSAQEAHNDGAMGRHEVGLESIATRHPESRSDVRVHLL